MLVIFICVSASVFILSSCNKKHEVYNIDTELGDHLTVEVYLSGNIDGLYLKYEIYNKDYDGLAFFSLTDKFRTELPSDPLRTFETVGAYGKTHFYRLHDEIIYVFNDERIGRLPSYYNIYI